MTDYPESADCGCDEPAPWTDDTSFTSDANQDGIADTLTQTFSDGSTMVITDTDGDQRADLLSLDVTGDGIPDVLVSGDPTTSEYAIATDPNGDQYISDDEIVGVSGAELDEVVPGATDALNIEFDASEYAPATDTPVPDSTVQPGSHVPAASPEPAEPDWRTALANDPTLNPNEFGQIGDADDWNDNWFEQAENGYCAPASVAQIVSEYTGHDYTDESAFVALAQENGLLGTGSDAANGMMPEDVSKLLTLCGIPAETQQGDIDTLAQAIDDDRGVMVAIDSGEYWSPASENGEDQAVDHCVVVTEIDQERGVVYLSDPGHPQGNELQMPIEQFQDAWADGGNTMIVCDQPAVAGDGQEATSGVDSPIGEANRGAGEPDSGHLNVQQAVNDAAHEVTAGSASGVVDLVRTKPWILLPVVIPAGAVVARKLVQRRNTEQATAD